MALTLTPMMCSKLLRHQTSHHPIYNALERFFQGMSSGYRRALAACLRHRVVVIAVFVAVAAGGGALFTLLKSELSPLEDRGFFIGVMAAPEGATVDYTDGYARMWEKMYSEVPEITSYFVVVAPGLDRPSPVNFALSFVRFKDWEERTRKSQEITASLAPKMFATMPGVLAFPVNPPSLGQSFRNPPVQFVVQGNSYEDLDRKVDALMAKARAFPGLVNVDSDLKLNKPQLSININREKAANLGIQVETIGRTRQARGQGPPAADRSHFDLRARRQWPHHAAFQPGDGAGNGGREGTQPLQPSARGDHLGERGAGLHAFRSARFYGTHCGRGAHPGISDVTRRSVAGIPRVRPAALFRFYPGARLHLSDIGGAV
jgi:multidrug efflux pump subunit AcrB